MGSWSDWGRGHLAKMKTDNQTGDGDEFDYFDENPDDDPFMPKPTCGFCGGSGFLLTQEGKYVTCYGCNGTGVEDGR